MIRRIVCKTFFFRLIYYVILPGTLSRRLHLTKSMPGFILYISERRIGLMLWKMIGVLLFKGVMFAL